MINRMAQIYDDILPFVSKPTRYIGKEFNSVVKEHDSLKVKFLLAFPEVYEVGMSYLGFKVLYEIINKRNDALAERVFAPWIDMEAELKKNNISLYSLETFTPVSNFDIIGFTLQYEMTFTNVLQILNLGKIPIYAKDRGEGYPIIIGGGPVAYNPEPVADFFDAFVIGEGEEIINEIIDEYKEKKQNRLNKVEFLGNLAGIDGIYVPLFYDVFYNPDGTMKKIQPNKPQAKERIKKRIIADFNKAFCPHKPVVPFMNVIQDRVTIEILRGCTRGCRFCISGFTSRPFRERDSKVLINCASEYLKNTGYDEISLSSLSSTEHSEINYLINSLNNAFSKKRVSISIPSSRIDVFSVELADRLSSIRKSTLTFALEAATERLRSVINKLITEEELIKTTQIAFMSGWRNIKLYFMLGLPTETNEDVLAIANLFKKINKSVIINIAFFVPKAHTPFSWEPQDTIESFKSKINLIKNKISPKYLKWHSMELSFLEGVFARGDRKLSNVIYKAWEKGARFDAWQETFKFNAWEEAFKECKIKPEFYANRKRNYNEVFPWDHIDTGVTKEFLIIENEKARKGEKSLDCRLNGCLSCGMENVCNTIKAGKQLNTSHLQMEKQEHKLQKTDTQVKRIRVRYSKGNEIRFLSHLDIINTIQKILMRSGLPVVFTSGFNPRIKLSFSPALPVGVSSIAEYFDFEIYAEVVKEELKEILQKNSPSGITILEVQDIPLGSKNNPNLAVYEIDSERTIASKEFKISVKLNQNQPSNVFKILENLIGLPQHELKKLNIRRIALQ